MTTATKMTNAEKIKVLEAARDTLLDPEQWTKGAYQENALDEDGELTDEGKKAYCVMGAVAKAAGFIQDNGQGENDAPMKLAECSLATAVFSALPDSEKSWVFDQYSEFIYDDHGDWDGNLPEGVKENADTIEEATAYLLENHFDSTTDAMLDIVYGFNDADEREREEIIEVLDRAIENLKS